MNEELRLGFHRLGLALSPGRALLLIFAGVALAIALRQIPAKAGAKY